MSNNYNFEAWNSENKFDIYKKILLELEIERDKHEKESNNI